MLKSAFSSFLNRGLAHKKIISSCVKAASTNIPQKNPNFVMDLEVNRIVWMDLEMTGLNVEKDTIMEIACIVTDTDLNIIAESPDLIIHTPDEQLEQMNEWCINQHGKTGLTEASRKSDLSVLKAEEIILNFVKEHVTEKASPVAGNSIYMDRTFIIKYMPRLNDYLHYRLIDVSTVKELCRRWNIDTYRGAPKKEYTHRSLMDIRESISELKYYKDHFFKTKLN